ncbi:hypothetical protein ACWOFH_01800 [Aerococcus christensenii]|nr:hypothetical protein [Aerococcus christensenii]WEB70964.1 hypothetical protein PUW42_07995 [Aerococcus christensenii]
MRKVERKGEKTNNGLESKEKQKEESFKKEVCEKKIGSLAFLLADDSLS